MVLGDTGSSGTARREDISSVHFEPFWTLAFVLAVRNELRFDSLELGPSNRCSSSSSSRTLARPALTLQEDTSSGLGTCKRCKRETGLVRHGTNMHRTNTLRLKWNTKMLWQVFKSTQSTSSKAFLMLQLSGRSFTMLHVSSKVTFRPLIWLHSDFSWILDTFLMIPCNYVIWTHLHLYHQLVSHSEYCFSQYQILGLHGHSPGMGMHLGIVKNVIGLFVVWPAFPD